MFPLGTVQCGRVSIAKRGPKRKQKECHFGDLNARGPKQVRLCGPLWEEEGR